MRTVRFPAARSVLRRNGSLKAGHPARRRPVRPSPGRQLVQDGSGIGNSTPLNTDRALVFNGKPLMVLTTRHFRHLKVEVRRDLRFRHPAQRQIPIPPFPGVQTVESAKAYSASMSYPLTPSRFQVSIGVQCRSFGLVKNHSGGEEDGFEQVDTHHWPPWTVKAGSAARPVRPNAFAKQTSRDKMPAVSSNFNL
jgi:hypothetical protein